MFFILLLTALPVKCVVNVAEVFVGNVRIDLGGLDVRVT